MPGGKGFDHIIIMEYQVIHLRLADAIHSDIFQFLPTIVSVTRSSV
jgi:hypothetical protein